MTLEINFFKRIVFAVFATVLSVNLGLSARESSWKVIKSDQSEFVVEYSPNILNFDESESFTLDLELFISIVAGSESLYETRLLTVPGKDKFRIDSYEVFRPFGDDLKSQKDDLNEYLNPELVYLGKASGRHVAELRMPRILSLKPDKGSRTFSTIVTKIKFDPVENKPVISGGFDPEITLNHAETKNWRYFDDKPITTAKPSKETALNSGQWGKIQLTEEGIYKIDASALADAGVNPPADKLGTIKVYGYGGKELDESIETAAEPNLNETPIIVRTNGNGSLDYVLFYGAPPNGFAFDEDDGWRHYINHYDTKSSYLITWGGEPGLRAEPLPTPDAPADFAPSKFISRIFFEEEIFNAFVNGYGSGRRWYGNNIFPTTRRDRLYDLDRSGKVIYTYALAHSSDSTGFFTVSQNGKVLKDSRVGYSKDNYHESMRIIDSASCSASEIPTDNMSLLKFTYRNLKSPYVSAYFDWLEISYPRYLTAHENELKIYTEPDRIGIGEYSISNYSGEIFGFETTDPAKPKALENISSTGGIFKFKIEIEENSPKSFFVSSKIKNASVSSVEFEDLRNNFPDVDLVVIAPKALQNSAKEFADYRIETGTSAAVALTEDVYEEFACGATDPTAVRNFLAYLYKFKTRKPMYVLLWGDGHYDYKNLKKTGMPNYVLPFESEDDGENFNAKYSYTTDDYFVRVDGDDKLVDMAIGRMPVTSDDLGSFLVEKVKHYESGSSDDYWRSFVTLIADDSYKGDSDLGDGASHTNDSEDLSRNYISSDMQQKKIYLAEYPAEKLSGGIKKPGVTQEMINAINLDGSAIVNWYGHGNPRVLAHEEIFERSITTREFTNFDKLFFLTAATCDFARFDMPDAQSGAELLVQSDYGGAVAVFSASRVVYAGQNAALNRLLYEEIFKRNPETGEYRTLGEIIFSVKQVRHDTNDEKFFLLGDPSMKLIVPSNRVTIETINGRPAEEDNPVEIKALSEVTITGSVVAAGSGEVMSDFDGVVLLTMNDCDVHLEVDDYFDGSIHRYSKAGGMLNRSAYPAESGRFEATFIVPKDISFQEDRGRLYAYAFDEESEIFAKGGSRAFVMDGVDTTAAEDDQGPEISIYLDSRRFKPGDFVQDNPILIVDIKDESGVNATGLGIGHKPEAWIDDSPKPIDLTDNYKTDIDDSKAGYVETRLYGLEPGVHTVKVRAWDVYNNYSISETTFRISDGELLINDVGAYPNPFETSTNIKFSHNASPPFDAEIGLYNSLGERVRSIETVVNTALFGEVVWDGAGSVGESLPSGTYYANVRIVARDGRIGNGSGTVVLVR